MTPTVVQRPLRACGGVTSSVGQDSDLRRPIPPPSDTFPSDENFLGRRWSCKKPVSQKGKARLCQKGTKESGPAEPGTASKGASWVK